MAKYTETLEELNATLRKLAQAIPATAVDQGTINALLAGQEELKKLVREVNGTAKQNCVKIGQVEQWQQDHSQTHETMDKRMDGIDSRVSRWIVGNFSLATLITGLGQVIQGTIAHLRP